MKIVASDYGGKIVATYINLEYFLEGILRWLVCSKTEGNWSL